MDDINNLMTVLGILDNYWDKLTSDLSDDELTKITNSFEDLKGKIEASDDMDQMNSVAKDFVEVLTKIEPLSYLAEITKVQTRAGSLPEPKEEIKIRILNYCQTVKVRVDNKRGRIQTIPDSLK